MATALPTIRFSSDIERKNYEAGLELARRNLDAGRRADAARKADQAELSAAALVKRLGVDLAAKCFGAENPKAKHFQTIATAAVSKGLAKVASPVKPTAPKAPTRKNYSAADEPAWPRATRFLSVSAGTGAAGARKIYSGGGLFGRSFA